MTRHYVSEGLRRLSRYLETSTNQLGDLLFGDHLKPVYSGIGPTTRIDYTRDTREDLDGNVLWAKHGGKLHESGRLLKIHVGNGRGVIEVDMAEKPKDKTIFDWIRETYGISRDKVSQALKHFK